ncbi:MAG: hypothetical protein H7Y43_08265 [Akkermansiaceae bacterium]|nr:hypothetical protein [Verrucomicrobiales bacterium]
MRATQGQELMTRDEPVREEVYGEFARIQAAEKEAASKITMFALVNRAQARLELTPPAPPGEDLKLTPALIAPATTELAEAVSKAESIPEPACIGEDIMNADAPPDPESASAIAASSSPGTETVAPVRHTAEPVSDEERNFPL